MAPTQKEEESVEFCLGSLMLFIVTPIPLIVIILRSIARRWPYHLRWRVLFLRASVTRHHDFSSLRVRKGGGPPQAAGFRRGQASSM